MEAIDPIVPYAVIQTHPQASLELSVDVERAPLVIRNLVRQGFEYFNPHVMVPGKRFGSVRRMPLFKDYVFVKVVDRWRALSSTYGVAHLLMAEREKPALLPDTEIERLRAMVNVETGCVQLSVQKFSVGEKVQLNAGPFSLASGLYDGQKDSERAWVLLNVLGAQRRVEINERDLVAA